MKLRRNLLWALLTAAIVVGAVLFALFYPGRSPELPAVTLPDTLPLLPEEDVEDFGSLTLAEVTPETVQAVVATMVRPDSYSRSFLVTHYWEGGSRSYPIQVWIKSGNLRLTMRQPEAGSETDRVKNILYTGGRVSLWYDEDTEHVYYYDGGEALGDLLQMLPTYEDVLALPAEEIADAGYVRRSGSWRIMVSCHDASGTLTVYYISIETGLLEEAERWEGERLIYSMEAGEADLSAPGDELFTLAAAPETAALSETP